MGTNRVAFTVVRQVHGIPVHYLAINKDGHRWVKNPDTAFRFATATGATHYMMTTADSDLPFTVTEVDSIPTAEQHPNNWKTSRHAAKPVQAQNVPLEPWRMSTGQRIAVTVGSCFGVLMMVALVAGW